MRVMLHVVVHPKEDGPGFFAVCSDLQGCHAEGDSIGEAVDNLQDVARVMLELRRNQGLALPATVPDGEPTQARLTVALP